MGVLTLTLSGCGTTIKDKTFYTDAGDQGAIVSHFLTDQMDVIDAVTWHQMLFGKWCMDYTGIADFKREIEQLCSVSPCNYEAKEALSKFFLRAEGIDRRIRSAR